MQLSRFLPPYNIQCCHLLCVIGTKCLGKIRRKILEIHLGSIEGHKIEIHQTVHNQLIFLWLEGKTRLNISDWPAVLVTKVFSIKAVTIIT